MCNNNNVVYRIEESLLSLFTSCKRAAHLYKKNIAENSIQLKNTRLLFVCVNVNMLVLRDDLRSSWKFWQFWIILYVSILILYIRRSILSRIEHPLWLYAFNFNEKRPPSIKEFSIPLKRKLKFFPSTIYNWNSPFSPEPSQQPCWLLTKRDKTRKIWQTLTRQRLTLSWMDDRTQEVW